jgi:hypothetical protein
LPICFFGLFDAAEPDQCSAARLLCGHAGTQVVVDVHLEMALHLGGEFALTPFFAEDASYAEEPCANASQA